MFNSGFFSVYELTNKGSSAIGPLVLSVVQQVTGELRYGFIFVALSMMLTMWGLIGTDVVEGKEAADAAGEPALQEADLRNHSASDNPIGDTPGGMRTEDTSGLELASGSLYGDVKRGADSPTFGWRGASS